MPSMQRVCIRVCVEFIGNKYTLNGGARYHNCEKQSAIVQHIWHWMAAYLAFSETSAFAFPFSMLLVFNAFALLILVYAMIYAYAISFLL